MIKGQMSNRARLARSLGVVGGAVGLAGVLIAIFFSGLDFVLVISDENIEVSRTLVGMAWSMIGILGGIMSWKNPKVPGAVMLISGVAGLVTMPEYFSVGGIILIIGAVVALTSKADEPAI